MVDAATGSSLRELELPPPPRSLTYATILHGWREDAERWLRSVLAHPGDSDWEVLLVDNSGQGVGEGLADGDRVRVLALEPPLGWAEAANAAVEAAAGETVVLFDPGTELEGEVAGPLQEALAAPGVVAAGLSGVRGQGNLKHFHADQGPVVDALEGYCLAFRRRQALEAGGFDRRFRFYRIADFDFSVRLRDRFKGDAVVVPGLPVAKHAHRLWEALPEAEREKLSKRNFYRFLDRWGERPDLVVGNR